MPGFWPLDEVSIDEECPRCYSKPDAMMRVTWHGGNTTVECNECGYTREDEE